MTSQKNHRKAGSGHKRSDTYSEISDIYNLYEDPRTSGHGSRNSNNTVTSVEEIVKQPVSTWSTSTTNTTDRDSEIIKQPVSTWSTSTTSTTDRDSRPSKDPTSSTTQPKSKRPETPSRPKREGQNVDIYFKPGSSCFKTPPVTPKRGMSPAAQKRVLQSPDAPAHEQIIRRHSTLEKLEGGAPDLSPSSKKKLDKALQARKDAAEEEKRKKRELERQAAKAAPPRKVSPTRRPTGISTSKPEKESDEARQERKRRAADKDQEKNPPAPTKDRSGRSAKNDHSRREGANWI